MVRSQGLESGNKLWEDPPITVLHLHQVYLGDIIPWYNVKILRDHELGKVKVSFHRERSTIFFYLIKDYLECIDFKSVLIIAIPRTNLSEWVLTKIIFWRWTWESELGSGSQEKVAVQEIAPRSIPMQGIKSVPINVTKNDLKRRG